MGIQLISHLPERFHPANADLLLRVVRAVRGQQPAGRPPGLPPPHALPQHRPQARQPQLLQGKVAGFVSPRVM